MKKYKLLDSDTKVFFGRTLFRIQALNSFGDVQEGDLGGYIEKEKNLSHDGNAWVYNNAQVFDEARVWGNAQVFDEAWVWGNAKIFGNVQIYGDARVYGDAHISEDARIYGSATISGNAYVCDNAYVGGNSWVFSDADILYIKGIGSAYPCITVCMTRDRKLFVMRQPFFGTLSEFETEVKKTYSDSKNAREYQLFIELVKLHFNIEEN